MEKPILLDQTPEELGAYLTALHQPAFRAKQVFSWLHKGASFGEMTNLPAALRAALAQCAVDRPVRVQETFSSKLDDTVKFLYALSDGNLIEGVLMRYHYGYSLCVSTQVGCKMGCAFCASTLGGCVRSLSAGEMLGQVLEANRFLGEKGRVGHVVLMGSGEPLENYDNVLRFLRLLNHPDGLNLSLRNVSLSTCGIVPRIRELAEEKLPVTLSISLHAPNDEIRRAIMPVARRYPIAQLMDAVRDYVRRTGRRVVFEYALIGGLNSAPEHARELAALVRGLQCHVNLIPLNDVPERDLRSATPQQVQRFLHTLEELHVSATCRREMGDDIAGACGQLRNARMEGDKA
ncbi:MAG: 23S rRNA (adenine(2503)-C(2))-methyltransferase RlmN [Clostridia bacterium]|nr:23S rRNA (adenine(2503)-C(2))-methyltransferase RlmN [Clostridia bacterium]